MFWGYDQLVTSGDLNMFEHLLHNPIITFVLITLVVGGGGFAALTWACFRDEAEDKAAKSKNA